MYVFFKLQLFILIVAIACNVTFVCCYFSTIKLFSVAAVGYSQMEQSSVETLLPVQHVSSDQSLPVGERMEFTSKAHSGQNTLILS